MPPPQLYNKPTASSMFYSESELPHKLQPPGSCLPPAIGIRLLNPGSVPSIPAVTGPLASHRCCASSNCPLPSAVGCLSLAMAVGSPASPWWPTAGPGSSMELMLAGHLFHTKVPGETSKHCLFLPCGHSCWYWDTCEATI